MKAIYPVSAGSYSLVVGSFGPGQTACNNAQHATNGKGGNTTFGTLVASGGSGGTQRSEGSYPLGNGIALANVTTGATSVIKNLIGQDGVGANSGTGGSNGLKNIENISTYGQGPASTENFTAGNHATGNGNGGGGGASCQGGHRGGGNGSSGYAIIKY